ncbi:hypothetical protein CZ809_03499 [Photobacterium piscicola]|uniref:Uncharacterized protein n=1 Tax=Photobacterium piscicola TaxID=1378299 RepID=A0A1T5I492_9GAMM|nr:hypothetical protein CZ809_03499 [Photobacterium piscicola]
MIAIAPMLAEITPPYRKYNKCQSITDSLIEANRQTR